MKYFIDTEFHEFKKKPLFSKGTDTIELISIGIVAEDGREYYAISNDFDLKAAWDNEWLRNNVLINIHYELSLYECNHKLKFDKWKELVSMRDGYSKRHFKTLKKLLDIYGYTNKQIAEEVKLFVSNHEVYVNKVGERYFAGVDPVDSTKLNCEFYGYYSDYDWVVFCWLFGRMIDLPKGFPMYCIDLKQDYDRKLSFILKEKEELTMRNFKHNPYLEINSLKDYPNYPKQTNEHNALDDAKWNLELYKFLQSI